MYIPLSSSMRFTEPKIEIYSRDRRSGAYPTKARTGDRTRTGKNKFYFDDTRTVMFLTATTINLPTTFHTGSSHLARDMTSSFTVRGNVTDHTIDQWIAHRDQSEIPGPFIEHFQYEQDETNVVNSVFMTGSAATIAPDRFKSKLSNKTIIRIEIPLTSSSVLDPLTGSLYFLNTSRLGFDQVAKEIVRIPYGGSRFPTTWAPLPFTPYGFHFMPLTEHPFSALRTLYQLRTNYPKIPGYASDGSDDLFWPGGSSTQQSMPVTASVLNSRHRANVSQSIDLSQYISHPFLLEKVVVELPFAAGPKWLNDRFRFTVPGSNPNVLDMGGPLITFALMRQDSDLNAFRDIIASGTVTTALDMVTGTYEATTGTAGGFNAFAVVPNSIGHFINPSVVITGSDAPSGSNNTFTGSVKLIMEPSITCHAFRMRASGSNIFSMFAPNSSLDVGARPTEALGMAFGAVGKRTGRTLQTSRNVLGNHFAFLDNEVLDGRVKPVKVVDTQYENMVHGQGTTATRSKVYTDVVSKTSKSPYLLYPEDNLILAINKHRACGSSLPAFWHFDGASTYWTPSELVSNHDVQIPTGTLRITLYGDLIKEDREYHDTLNQRLETVELWETIGEEPTLDQFDVAYTHELSGSYLDRNNIFRQVPYAIDIIGSGGDDGTGGISLADTLFQFRNDIGHFGNVTPTVEQRTWNTLASGDGSIIWPNARYAYELRKSNKNPQLTSYDELFWDTRIPNPPNVAEICNPRYVLATDWITCLEINAFYSSDGSDIHSSPSSVGSTTGGIRDWFMSYPYESRYSHAQYTFYSNLTKDLFHYKLGTFPHGPFRKLQLIDYDSLSIELGDFSGSHSSCARFLASEGYIASTAFGTGYVPLKKPEFIKFFFGIGDGIGTYDNGHVRPRVLDSNNNVGVTADVRGWRHGMMNAFPMYSTAIFRRNRYGHFRDMLEQRPDTKYYIDNVIRESPIQVEFFDREGNLTDSTLTLSSNLSSEATSSFPYADGLTRNRGTIDYTVLNISSVVL